MSRCRDVLSQMNEEVKYSFFIQWSIIQLRKEGILYYIIYEFEDVIVIEEYCMILFI